MMDDGHLGSVIAATFAAWEQWPSTHDILLDRERAIYGTADPNDIAHVVDQFCVYNLGAHIAAYLFYASSQGAVSGIGLSDGQRVVVKAHAPTWTPNFLNAVQRVQRRLVARGFPCPRPLLRPTRLGHGYATVEELVDDGSHANAHQPAIRRAMAATLARLVASTHDLRALPGLRSSLRTRLPPDALWPLPHSPIFDFETTREGAEWIDCIAAGARETLAEGAGDTVIGHTDWSVQNCRFVGDAVRVVYDWDSLTLDKETTIVAQAAMNLPFNWLLPEPPAAPTPDEARFFVQEYAEARGRPFNAAEWEGMAAAATYALAYGARLEHSLHPEQTDFPQGSARARLAVHGATFLQSE